MAEVKLGGNGGLVVIGNGKGNSVYEKEIMVPRLGGQGRSRREICPPWYGMRQLTRSREALKEREILVDESWLEYVTYQLTKV